MMTGVMKWPRRAVSSYRRLSLASLNAQVKALLSDQAVKGSDSLYLGPK